jgi:hypothetical protein
VPVPRPRRVDEIHTSPEFQATYERLWKELRPEVTLAE